MSGRDGISAILSEHRPGTDWHCACGVDCFGGSAAYSQQLLFAHVVDLLAAHEDRRADKAFLVGCQHGRSTLAATVEP